jgi:hypothetical protein
MTGYQSKRAAAQDKIDDDDDIQVYKKPWVSLTKTQREECITRSEYHTAWSSDIDLNILIDAVNDKLKELNA